MTSDVTKPAASEAKRTVSPLVFMAGSVFVLCVLLAVFVGVLSTFEPDLPGSNALQEVVMPDGTILALEAVTWGKSHTHSVNRQSPGFSFFSGRSHYPMRHSTGTDVTMVWFTRRDARTGRALDFDWWSHCVAVDSHGCEIPDEENYCHRDAISEYGSSGSGGSRPFSPVSSVGGGRQYSTIIVRTALKPMRHGGNTFPLRMYDVDGKVVGEFTITDPSPTKGIYPEWKAEELPITRSVDGLSVTLNSVAGILNENRGSRNGRPYVKLRTRLQYDFTMEENGEPSSRWNSNSVVVSDALGNTINAYDVSPLCTQESAWKLTANFYRGRDEKNFEESELWRVKDLKLAEAGKHEYLRKKTEIDGAELEVIATGGPGKITYTGLGSSRSSGGHSSSGGVGDKQYEVERKSSRGAPGTTTVTCDLPHILLRWSTQNPRHRVDQLQATDGHGHPLELNGPHGGYGADTPNVYFVTRPRESKITDPIKTVSFTFAVQTAREAVFFVRPPEATPPEPRQYTPYTPAQRVGNARRNIEQYEKQIAARPERTYNFYLLASAVAKAPEELRTPAYIDTAVDYAQMAVAESPTSRNYLNTLAMALLRKGDPGAALRFQNNLVNDLRDNVSVADLYGLALAQFQQGDEAQGKRTYDRAVARHRQRLPYLQSSHEWQDLYALREELQTLILGASPQDLVAQADELVAGGRLEEAAKVFDRLLAVSEGDVWQWYRSAVLQLHNEDTAAWQKHCERMLELFGNSNHPETAERIGKTCLLAASSDVTRVHAQGLIEKALAQKPDNMWFTLAKGLAQYRTNQDSAAVALLEKSLTLQGRAASADVCIHALLAMSRFRQREEEAARMSLAQAESIRTEKLPSLTGGKLKDGWHDVLIAEILLREARSIVTD